jgi:hypothetical protein
MRSARCWLAKRPAWSNPLTGEGIDYALESGTDRCRYPGAPAPESEYHVTLHQRFGRVFRFSEHVRDWYCKPLLLNALVPLANRIRSSANSWQRSSWANANLPLWSVEMLARLVVRLVRPRPRV